MKRIDEILCEMRKDIPRVVDAKVILRNYADRIEAVVKHQFRDTTKLIPEEVVVAENATTTPTCEKSSQVGNAAAMFNALKQIDRIVWDKRRHTKEEVEAHRLATEALSIPPRNCDVIEGMNADDEFEKAMGYPPSQTADERDELMRENWYLFKLWLYAETKGLTNEDRR